MNFINTTIYTKRPVRPQCRVAVTDADADADAWCKRPFQPVKEWVWSNFLHADLHHHWQCWRWRWRWDKSKRYVWRVKVKRRSTNQPPVWGGWHPQYTQVKEKHQPASCVGRMTPSIHTSQREAPTSLLCGEDDTLNTHKSKRSTNQPPVWGGWHPQYTQVKEKHQPASCVGRMTPSIHTSQREAPTSLLCGEDDTLNTHKSKRSTNQPPVWGGWHPQYTQVKEKHQPGSCVGRMTPSIHTIE